jgi:hypothetical protein
MATEMLKKSMKTSSGQRRHHARRPDAAGRRPLPSSGKETSTAVRVDLSTKTAVPAGLLPFLETRDFAKLTEAVKADPRLAQHPFVVRTLAHALAQGRVRLTRGPGRRGRWTRLKGMSHCRICARAGEPCQKHVSIDDDLEMLGQYETVLDVLRTQPVKRQTDGYDVTRLMPIVRKAWEEFAWELWDPDEHVPAAAASYGEARPLTSKELNDFWQQPVVIHPIRLKDHQLRILIMKALRPEKRRDAPRARLAYALLAERWKVPPGVVRSRIQAARKLRNEMM